MKRSVWLFSAAGVKILSKKKKSESWLTFHTHGNGGTEKRGSALVIPELDGRAGTSQAQVQSTALCSLTLLPRSEHSKWDQSADLHLRLSFLFLHGVNRANKHQSEAPEACLRAIWTTLFAISLINKAWRQLLELQSLRRCYQRVPVDIVQNSKKKLWHFSYISQGT